MEAAEYQGFEDASEMQGALERSSEASASLRFKHHSRILKNHDLDVYLVYGKRDRNHQPLPSTPPTLKICQPSKAPKVRYQNTKNIAKCPKRKRRCIPIVPAIKSSKPKHIQLPQTAPIKAPLRKEKDRNPPKNILSQQTEKKEFSKVTNVTSTSLTQPKYEITAQASVTESGSSAATVALSVQENPIVMETVVARSFRRRSWQRGRRARKFEKDSFSEDEEKPRCPFENFYVARYRNSLATVEQANHSCIEELGLGSQGTYLNCDVRYFNWELFTRTAGKFDVVIIDPPWRIKGAQQNDTQFMFSNSKFSLDYNTMSNNEITRIPLQVVSDNGLIFLWILNSQLDASLKVMQAWGYQFLDNIVWFKLKDGSVNLTHGYYFMHSFEMCLVGYKSNGHDAPLLRAYMASNSILANVQSKSQKPEDLYSVINMMFPGSKKLQIFARNHNLRLGIFSLGNELGESFRKWEMKFSCDSCSKQIVRGHPRFKSRLQPAFDLCEACIGSHDSTEYIRLENQVDEDVLHEYMECNSCGVKPIWGTLFRCEVCADFDVCENCFDQHLEIPGSKHPSEHSFGALEVPVYGSGMAVHDTKCESCLKNPIIGPYFSCRQCRNLNLCQKCFFAGQATLQARKFRAHESNHHFEAIYDPQPNPEKVYNCFKCRQDIEDECWMCQNCFNFFFCHACYADRKSFKSPQAHNHKHYHVFTKVF